MSKTVKEILVPVVSLLVICLVAAGLLAGVNEITKEKIAAGEEKAVLDAQSALLPDASDYENGETNGTAYVIGRNEDGSVNGYIFTTSANGYGGAVQLMTAVDRDGSVLGISILSINETPGLGMKAKSESWLDQFKGITGSVGYTKDGAPGENEINALTSATITTKAFTAAVNKALALYDSVKED